MALSVSDVYEWCLG